MVVHYRGWFNRLSNFCSCDHCLKPIRQDANALVFIRSFKLDHWSMDHVCILEIESRSWTNSSLSKSNTLGFRNKVATPTAHLRLAHNLLRAPAHVRLNGPSRIFRYRNDEARIGLATLAFPKVFIPR